MNTILDDISAVIGFSATLKLVAWFGDGTSNMYVPTVAEEGQLLPKIIGLSAARALSKEWPGKHLNVPRLSNYDIELRRGAISRMLRAGMSTREIASVLQMSERRVLQIRDELTVSDLLGLDVPVATQTSVAPVVVPESPPPAAAAGINAMVRGGVASTATVVPIRQKQGKGKLALRRK